MAMAAYISRLPPELLDRIFTYTFAPHSFLETSHAKRGSPSFRENVDMKLSLSEVCQAWNGVANRLLYREVFLWDFQQATVFKKTMYQSPKHLGALVSSLFLQDVVIPQIQKESSNTTVVFKLEHLLNELYILCPNISSLTMKFVDNPGTPILPSSPFTPYLYFWSSSNLRELSLSVKLFPSTRIRDISQYIERLTLIFDCDLSWVKPVPGVWPLLTTVQYDLNEDCLSGGLEISNAWSIPSLTSVSISSPAPEPVKLSPLFADGDNASRIRQFTFDFSWIWVSELNRQTFLETVLNSLPNLEHLVWKAPFWPRPDNDNMEPPHHASLRYVDIWGQWTRNDELPPGRGPWNHDLSLIQSIFDNHFFPNLRSIRFFDKALASSVAGLGLSVLFPPDPESTSALPKILRMRYPGVDIGVLDGRVFYRNDLFHIENDLAGETVFRHLLAGSSPAPTTPAERRHLEDDEDLDYPDSEIGESSSSDWERSEDDSEYWSDPSSESADSDVYID